MLALRRAAETAAGGMVVINPWSPNRNRLCPEIRQGARSRHSRDGSADIVIDAGGRDSVELRAAMTVADVLYIPIQASQFDVWTLDQMNVLVEQARHQ
jgi:hypothetical protein